MENSPTNSNGAQPNAPLFLFSRFTGKLDNAPTAAQLDARGLSELFSRRHFRAAKDGPLLSGAIYPTGTTRANENVSAVSLAILDFDGGTTLEEIEASAARLNNGDGAATFIYSTFSHTPETPKFRVVLPLSAPVAASDWPEVWHRLALAFDGTPDASAKDAARMHYLPSCPKSRGADAIYRELDGAPLDVATLPKLPAPSPEAPQLDGIGDGVKYQPPAPDNRRPLDERARLWALRALADERAKMEAAGKGQRHAQRHTSAHALGGLVPHGLLSESEVFDALAINFGADKIGAQKTIRDGIRSGKAAPRTLPDFTRNRTEGHQNAPISSGYSASNEPLELDGISDCAPEFEVFSFSDLELLPRPKWLVRSLLVENTISVLSADGGSFKSFFALDLALSIATGTPFHGREVKRGAVVYVAAEGFYTVHERALAWSQVRGVTLPENFHILRAPVNVSDARQVARFAAQFSKFAPAFAVLDTLSQNAIGLNENANEEMARFMAGMAATGAATGAHVMAVHHNAKATGSFRGAGAIKNNVDTHISLDRPDEEDERVNVRCEKQRGRPFEAFELRGEEIDTGKVDEFGDVVTSLVFETTGTTVAPKSAKHPNAQRAGAMAARLLELFTEIARENSDGVKIGTWAGRAIKSDENPDGLCASSTFWEHVKTLKGDGKKSERPQIEPCGTHNGAELWRICELTPTTPTTPIQSCRSDSHKPTPPLTPTTPTTPLGVGVIGVAGSGAETEKKTARQKRAKNSPDAEPYKAIELDTEAAGVDI